MSGVLTRGTLVMAVERCKGCELCIPACRPGVLEMSEVVNEHGFPYPLLMPGCTACKACFDVCPDYVFEVYKYDTPILIGGAGGAGDGGGGDDGSDDAGSAVPAGGNA